MMIFPLHLTMKPHLNLSSYHTDPSLYIAIKETFKNDDLKNIFKNVIITSHKYRPPILNTSNHLSQIQAYKVGMWI